MSKLTTSLIVLLFFAFIALFTVVDKVYKLRVENKALKKETIFLKKLVLKGANRDSLYREHMGKTLYIDNNSVEIGHDNYLRLKPNGVIKND